MKKDNLITFRTDELNREFLETVSEYYDLSVSKILHNVVSKLREDILKNGKKEQVLNYPFKRIRIEVFAE